MPNIVILIPVFNGKRFIRAAMDSVWPRDADDPAVIVTLDSLSRNDNFPAGTADMVRKHRPRMRLSNAMLGWAQYLRQPARFVIVGACNTALSYITYCVCLYFGADVWLANLLGWTIGIFVSFFAQRSFVFMNRDRGRFGRFLFTALSIYSIQTLLIGLLVVHGYNAALAGILVLPGQVVASYIAQKYFVFGAPRRGTRGGSLGPEQ